mgnify:FL=1
MRKQQVELLVVALVLAGVVGWFMNIFDIVAAVSDPITAMFILRCVGIFVAPLGAILGYC